MIQPYEQRGIIEWCGFLTSSFNAFVGRPLLEYDVSGEVLARELYQAEFVLVSHRFEDIPRFRFANAAAQKLWGYSWDEFNGMDSRLSAKPDSQEAREELLARAKEYGYVDDYSGVRVAKNGTCFEINDVILWTVKDSQQNAVGQAATFRVPN